MRLEITRRADLAVRALVELDAAARPLKSAELAERLDTTTGFVPHALGPLVTAGWVRSDPGPTGGYRLLADPSSLSVLDVVEQLEGPTDRGRCVVADRDCDEADTCALHHAWSRARAELLGSLGALTVAQVRPATP